MNHSNTPTILGLASSLTRYANIIETCGESYHYSIAFAYYKSDDIFMFSLCSGAECLFQIVHNAIPKEYIEGDARFSSAEVAVHILNRLYEKLNDACLVQGGEVVIFLGFLLGFCCHITFSSDLGCICCCFQEDSYRMLLYIFVGCLLPYIEVLDSWIFEGILDDPFEEVIYFYIFYRE